MGCPLALGGDPPAASSPVACRRISTRSGSAVPPGDETIEVWSALDALVLKATALVLTAHWLPDLSQHCHHLQGRGGAKAAVRFVHEHLAANTFVFRTDVKSYYASIDHDILLGLLEQAVPDRRVLDLLRQYVRRTIYDGGLYEDVERGISLGCPLSPLMGALYLKLLDERVEKTGLAYARFMDDWVILAPTRWKLREAIRLVNQTLAELKLQQHPDKTFIGRISRGFDFLGYAFTPAGLDVAPQTVERCVKRVSQLYEQGVDLIHIGAYVRRWLRWARSGLRALGAGLSERDLELVVRCLGRLGLSWCRHSTFEGCWPRGPDRVGEKRVPRPEVGGFRLKIKPVIVNPDERDAVSNPLQP